MDVLPWRRVIQPLPKPEKAFDDDPDGQENQYHHNRGAHTLNGDRSKVGLTGVAGLS
jgi:hypothetical protein